MTDLLRTLPNFKLTPQRSSILTALETRHITTSDLLTLEPLELSRRAVVSLLDLRRFIQDVIEALHQDLLSPSGYGEVEGDRPGGNEMSYGDSGFTAWKNQRFLSTTDAVLDELLEGGIMTGGITEIVGER